MKKKLFQQFFPPFFCAEHFTRISRATRAFLLDFIVKALFVVLFLILYPLPSIIAHDGRKMSMKRAMEQSGLEIRVGSVSSHKKTLFRSLPRKFLHCLKSSVWNTSSFFVQIGFLSANFHRLFTFSDRIIMCYCLSGIIIWMFIYLLNILFLCTFR